jgi:hypothetical protein
VSVTVTIIVPCPACGEPARLDMSPEAALRHASDVTAAAEGLRPVEVGVVRGEG